jgi:hypothetical protein
VLLTWRRPLDWWARAGAVAVIYLACLGLIYQFLEASFTNDLKIFVLIASAVLILMIFAVMKRLEIPEISYDIPDAVEIYHWQGVHAKYYNVTFSITSRFQKKATDCEGRLVFKAKSAKKAEERYPLAWIDSEKRAQIPLVRGGPRTLRVFLLCDKGMGACLVSKNLPEGHFPSLIDAGDYEYFRIELRCDEWAEFRRVKEWLNVRFPDFLESLPVKQQ